MAVNVDISRGVGTLTNPRFYKMAALVLGGMVFGTLAVQWLNSNAPNIDVRGEEAVYALVAVAVIRTAMSGSTSMLLASGVGAGMLRSLLAEFGVM